MLDILPLGADTCISCSLHECMGVARKYGSPEHILTRPLGPLWLWAPVYTFYSTLHSTGCLYLISYLSSLFRLNKSKSKTNCKPLVLSVIMWSVCYEMKTLYI